MFRQMLAGFKPFRMDAKRKALKDIVSKPAPPQQAQQSPAEEKPTKATAQPIQ